MDDDQYKVTDQEIATLQEELAHFRQEKEKIRAVVGQIGGAGSKRRDRIANIVFIGAIMVLLILDGLRHLFGVEVPVPALFSLELGLLLVSIKIIWMIHRQTKVEHFQFWILNAIEFRLTNLSRMVGEMARDRKDSDS